MACNGSLGFQRDTCPPDTPGAYATLYLFNRSQVASFSAGTGNIVEDITFTGGAGFYQVIAKDRSVIGRSELQENENDLTDYTHEFDFHLADISAESRDFFDSWVGATVGAIVRTKGDRFILYGYNEGAKLRVNAMTTEADGYGFSATFRETQVNEPPRIFFDTNTTTTLSNITTKIVGS